MRSIIDGGSQGSFIVVELSRKLRLPVVDEVEMVSNILGESALKRSKKYRVVKVTLHSKFSNTEGNDAMRQ